jgi:hypothetical protein
MDLQAAVAAALKPRDLGERLRLMLVGGLAPSQVLERLPAPLQESLYGGETNPILARRAAIEAVTRALGELVRAGRARRRRAQLKNALVDVYRG